MMRTHRPTPLAARSPLCLIWIACAVISVVISPSAMAQADRGDPCTAAPTFEASSLLVNGVSQPIGNPQSLLITLRPGDLFELTLSAALPDGCTEEGLVIDLAEGELPQFVFAAEAGAGCGGVGIMFPAEGGAGETPLEITLCGMPDASDFIKNDGFYQIALNSCISKKQSDSDLVLISIQVLDCGRSPDLLFDFEGIFELYDADSDGSPDFLGIFGAGSSSNRFIPGLFEPDRMTLFPGESVSFSVSNAITFCPGATISKFDLEYSDPFFSPTIDNIVLISESGTIIQAEPEFPITPDPMDQIVHVVISLAIHPNPIDRGIQILNFSIADSTGHISTNTLQVFVGPCLEPPTPKIQHVTAGDQLIGTEFAHPTLVILAPGEELAFELTGNPFPCGDSTITVQQSGLPLFLAPSTPFPAQFESSNPYTVSLTGIATHNDITEDPTIVTFTATDSTGQSGLVSFAVQVIDDCNPAQCTYQPELKDLTDEGLDFDILPGESLAVRFCKDAESCDIGLFYEGVLPHGVEFTAEASASDSCAVLEWTPAESHVGYHEFYFVSSTEAGAHDRRPVRVFVRAFDESVLVSASTPVVDGTAAALTNDPFQVDLVLHLSDGNVVSRLNSNGQGGSELFEPPSVVAAAGSFGEIMSIATMDATGSSLADYVIASNDSGSPQQSRVSVLPGDGAGGILSGRRDLVFPDLDVIATDTGDLDNDKDLDELAIAFFGDASAFGVVNPVVLLMNPTTPPGEAWPGFVDPATNPDAVILFGGDHPTGVSIGDVNRDGLSDIIVLSSGMDSVDPVAASLLIYVAESEGDNQFQEPIEILLDATPCVNDNYPVPSTRLTTMGSPIIADFDGVNGPDLVVILEACEKILYYPNLGGIADGWMGFETTEGDRFVDLAGANVIRATVVHTFFPGSAASDLVLFVDPGDQPGDDPGELVYFSTKGVAGTLSRVFSADYEGTPIELLAGDFDSSESIPDQLDDYLPILIEPASGRSGQDMQSRIRLNTSADSVQITNPDLNLDGVINQGDLSLLLSVFTRTTPFADLNEDGRVDTADLGIMIRALAQNPDR